MESMDLSNLERKIFLQYKKDGALETILGLAMMYIGMTKLTDTSGVFRTIVPIFVILFILIWKKRITFPRLGYFEFTQERRARTRRSVFAMISVAFITVALAIWGSHLVESGGAADPATVKSTKLLLSGGMLAIVIASVAGFMQIRHLFYFAALSFLLFAAAAWFAFSSGFAFLGLGLPLLVFGLIRLSHFLKQHPPQESPSNA